MIYLHNADCFDVFPKIASGTVDLVCADIPYGTTQCRWDSVLDLPLMWEQLYRIAKPSAAIVLFSAQPFTSVLINSNLRDWRSEWIWEKGNATGFLNAKKQPLRAHENIEVFYRRQPTYNPQMTHGHERRTSKRKTVNSECYGKALTLTKYDSTSR
ncbi:site-specific DNA-methyltransferase, partial [Klebsiella variicola]